MKNAIKTACLKLLLGMLILAGCSNPMLEGPETPENRKTGAVSVRIGTEEGQFKDPARTLAPAFSTYTLSFSGPTAQDEVNISSGTSATVALAIGAWTITATAYQDETPVAQGSATITVSAGSNSPVNIILAPLSEGEGTFSYSIEVPAGATGSASFVSILTGDTERGDSILLSSGTNPGPLSLPSGQYLMSVRLTLNGKAAGRTEVVHIYRNMITIASARMIADLYTRGYRIRSPLVLTRALRLNPYCFLRKTR